MQTLYALADGNNFFVSCERVFQPALQHQPVIVLSNNDGCVVSRSEEAKQLGIGMGVPFFEIRDLCRQQHIHVFSSNFELYADMSARVMTILEEFSPEIEHYSIDESFLKLNTVRTDYQQLGEQIRQRVWQCTGIPMSIGIAPSKTLAKLASHIAKKSPSGVLAWPGLSPQQQTAFLANHDISEIWGIGRQSCRALRALHINTALELAQANPFLIKKKLHIMGMRTVAELNGQACLELLETPPTKKGILCSRSFGQGITQLADLRAALSSFVEEACNKLQSQQSVAGGFTFFIRSNNYHNFGRRYWSGAGQLPLSSAYPADFSQLIRSRLAQIYEPGVKYHKAGIFLTEITSATTQRQSLFASSQELDQTTRQKVLASLSQVKQRFGPESIHFASSQLSNQWHSKKEKRSPRYSTVLTEIITAL